MPWNSCTRFMESFGAGVHSLFAAVYGGDLDWGSPAWRTDLGSLASRSEPIFGSPDSLQI